MHVWTVYVYRYRQQIIHKKCSFYSNYHTTIIIRSTLMGLVKHIFNFCTLNGHFFFYACVILHTVIRPQILVLRKHAYRQVFEQFSKRLIWRTRQHDKRWVFRFFQTTLYYFIDKIYINRAQIGKIKVEELC